MSDDNDVSTDLTYGEEKMISLEGMYKEYFLDYASYVILERAVPSIFDGLKPVQRRILHSLKEKDDGRYHKVANIIGHTMQYHPHGDAAIGAAMVNIGQKELLIDTQGNWGDYRTGDSAAAARYIEARLTKFALEVAFNAQTTDWQVSYDGRNKEPVNLPMKFPLVLAQGTEGIAVGLSTKILPHNFIELIKASIAILKEKKVILYPDFMTGGLVDVTDYQGGKRGGKIKVRAKIDLIDKNTIAIKELPYGVTTTNLIDSILKANDKGKIKIKKIYDNTAKDLEILIELHSGVSPDQTIDALYAFTNCEISISPNTCVIIDNKPHFLRVEDILKMSTLHTKALLGLELEIKRDSLQEKWHNASLEKIFIEKRIYRDIEEAESWEEVLKIIDVGLRKYVATPNDYSGASDKRVRLKREITQDDIARLTEIKIKRISKYNTFKADEQILQLEEDLKQVLFDLEHLTDFAIKYFQDLLDKYGKGKERLTEIAVFDEIRATHVVAKNAKLYVNREDGFVGFGNKKDEYVCDCSDIDDVIVFTKDGKFQVVRLEDKVFVGKKIIHVDVWKKNDERTTYNAIYIDGATGVSRAKRFNVKAITRSKDYEVTKGSKGSKLLYFTVNPNGESETVNVQLSPGCKAKKKVFDFDFSDLEIKGRGSQGNIVTKYPVRKVTLLEKGKSSLGALKVWVDEVSGRLNKRGNGMFLGAFDTGDCIIAISKKGTYTIVDLDFNKKFDFSDIIELSKFNNETIVSAVHYDAGKERTMVKRFNIETSKKDQAFEFISEEKGSTLYGATTRLKTKMIYTYKEGRSKVSDEIMIDDFIDVKGWKALGNRLIDSKLTKVVFEAPEVEETMINEIQKEGVNMEESTEKPSSKPSSNPEEDDLKAGDTIELDF